MKRKNIITIIVAIMTAIACIAIFVSFHSWVSELPRTTQIYHHGELSAYAQAYFLAAISCLFACIPFAMWTCTRE